FFLEGGCKNIYRTFATLARDCFAERLASRLSARRRGNGSMAIKRPCCRRPAFSPIRHAEDRSVAHQRMAEQDPLDLGRGDVGPAADDDILLAAHEPQLVAPAL